jgi:hypothetical protein
VLDMMELVDMLDSKSSACIKRESSSLSIHIYFY